jgi:CRP/FNR family transcriptional regulator
MGLEALRLERHDGHSSDYAALSPYSSQGNFAADKPSVAPHSFWRESLALVEQCVPFGRRKVQSGDRVYLCGESFETLYLIHWGLCKLMNLAPDGREQPADVLFKGEWLGFDGIPCGRHACSAIALESGELWTIRYDALLQASAKEPMVMRVVLAAISAQLARNRDAMLSMGTLTADARVADFLLHWAQSLAERGLRTDQINVHMTRADIGHYLGLTLESISRALSRLARCGVIEFNEKGRREISIPNLAALSDFIQSSTEPASPVLH